MTIELLTNITGPQGVIGPQGLPGTNAVPADTAVAGYVSTAGTSDTKTALLNRFGTEVAIRSVAEYGAVPSAVVDQATAINAAITAVPAGTILRIPAGDYKVDSTITIGKAITLIGPGRLVCSTDAAAIRATVDDVTIGGGLKAIGRQRTAWVNGARGITATGTLGTPIKRLTIGDVDLSTFAGGAVVLEFCNDVKMTDTKISTSTYFGIALLSVQRATILRATVTDINLGGLVNAYGITATRYNGTLAVYPRSTDVTITEATITDVTDWAGIDTHAGNRISAIRCIITGCKRGIDFVGSVDITDTIFAPIDALIQDCIVDGTGITTTHGIGLSGAENAGVISEYATGRIIGNHVVRCGDDTNNALGAFWFRTTRGMRHIGNRATEPGSHGVVFAQNNQSFHVSNFECTDPWSNTHTLASVVATRSVACTGIVTSFYGRRGTKTATTVLAWGLYQSDSSTDTTIILGADCHVEAGTLVVESGGGLRTFGDMRVSNVNIGRAAGKIGLYQATPVTKAAAISSPTADVTALKTAVDLLRTAVKNIGITS